MKRKINALNQPELTERETALISIFVCFGNQLNAATIAGYSPRSAKTLASRTLNKPLIKETVAAIKQRLATAA